MKGQSMGGREREGENNHTIRPYHVSDSGAGGETERQTTQPLPPARTRTTQQKLRQKKSNAPQENIFGHLVKGVHDVANKQIFAHRDHETLGVVSGQHWLTRPRPKLVPQMLGLRPKVNTQGKQQRKFGLNQVRNLWAMNGV